MRSRYTDAHKREREGETERVTYWSNSINIKTFNKYHEPRGRNNKLTKNRNRYIEKKGIRKIVLPPSLYLGKNIVNTNMANTRVEILTK